MRRPAPLSTFSSLGLTERLLSAVLLWSVGAPLLWLLAASFWDRESWSLLFRPEGAGLRSAAFNSVAVSGLSCVISTCIAAALAAWTTRRRFPLRSLAALVPYLPLTLPPLVGVMSFLFLFGEVGLFQGAWRQWIGNDPPGALQGFGAVLLVHIYSFTPLAYLLLKDAFVDLDADLDSAARGLGAGRLARWRAAWWDQLRPAVGGALWLCFMASMASFSAPYLLGGGARYLSTEIVARRLGGELELARMETVLLAGASLLLLFLRPRLSGRGTLRRLQPRPTSPQAGTVHAIGVLLITLLALLPHSTLLLLSFVRDGSWTWQPLPPEYSLENHLALFRGGEAWRPIGHSLLMAAPATLVGALWAIFIARSSLRGGRMPRALAEIAAQLPWAVPATALSMAWLAAYNRPSPAGFGLALAATPWLLPWAYCLRFIPLQIRAVASVLAAQGTTLENAARSLGAGPWRAARDISWPLIRPALGAASALVFVSGVGEFVVSVLLYVPENRPVSMEILEHLRVFRFGRAAALGSWLSVLLALVLVLAPNSSRTWQHARRN